MKLQTGASPLTFPVILSIVEQEYKRDWNRVFREIDSTPLGSASIAQA
ncbi:MAG: AarF/UbiB family protein, partial [Porphyromonas pasteri]